MASGQSGDGSGNRSSFLDGIGAMCAIIDRNIVNHIETTIHKEKEEEEGFLEASKEREDSLKKQIDEAQKKYENAKKQKAANLEKLRELNARDESKFRALDAKIEEQKIKHEQLLQAGEKDREYCAAFGGILTGKLGLDWQSEVGVVKCPAGHVVQEPNNNAVSGTGTCDFWTCPAVNLQ